jgi:crotonobetainyl-CoA:carnitine CoA-transferase CaiB-like acyl-CoA transferase
MSAESPGAASARPAPLAGIRVLELGHFIAAPFAGVILADLGADVIKVEDPDRPDDARSTGPHFLDGESLYFLSLNWGKRSLAVRLRRPEGRGVVLDLVRHADAVIDNYRPGVLARLGLDHAALAEVNPRLVTCSLTGFGETGAYATRSGYDYTIQATAGVMSLTGEPSGPPGKAGVSYVDHGGGMAGSLAICAALLERERTGSGRHIDLGLMDTQVSMLTYLAAWRLNAAAEIGRTADASHQSLVPAQNFATADGWVSVFVGNERNWRSLVEATADPRLGIAEYRTNAGRLQHRDRLLEVLRVLFRSRPTAEWVELLTSHGVPCAPVNSLAEALSSPPVRDRELVQVARNPHYGDYRHVAGPIPALGSAGHRGGPVLGEHSEEILTGIGYSADRLASLVEAGIVVSGAGGSR